MAERLPGLTGLRGLAALWVLLFHAWALGGTPPPGVEAPWLALLRAGWLGVDLFFVLSGFLLAHGWLRAPGGWPGLYLMRAARLLPAYYLQLVVLALLGGLGVKAIGWQPADAGSVLAHVLLWLNAWPWVPAHLGPWWSLAVEAVFYLSLPLVLPSLRTPRRALGLLLAAALLALLWRGAIATMDVGIEQRIGWAEHAPGRWVQFVAGAVLAAWWSGAWASNGAAAVSEAPAGRRRPLPGDAGSGAGAPGRAGRGGMAGALLLALLALALLSALPLLGGERLYNGVVDARPFTWAWPLLTTLPALGLLYAVLAMPAGGGRAWRLATAPLHGLGVVSYGLYLWHYPVQWLLRQQLGGFVPPHWGVEGFALASLLLTLPIALLSWGLLERPVLGWARRRRARLSPFSVS